MNWEAIGAIGEMLGAAGVILTLGYQRFRFAKTIGISLTRLNEAALKLCGRM